MSLLFLQIEKDEGHEIDTLIRRAYKQAIGIPLTLSTKHFEALGQHNTLSKLTKAQRLAQQEQLTYRLTGRHILNSLGITYPSAAPTKVPLPPNLRESIHIPPIPKKHTASAQSRAKVSTGQSPTRTVHKNQRTWHT